METNIIGTVTAVSVSTVNGEWNERKTNVKKSVGFFVRCLQIAGPLCLNVLDKVGQ